MIPAMNGHLCRHRHGKIPLFSHRAIKSLNSIQRIQPRMMCATYNYNHCTTIFSCYSPTNASGTDITIFSNELSSLVRYVPKDIMKTCMLIQAKMETINSAMYLVTHQIGTVIIYQFSLENKLAWQSNKFEKKKRKTSFSRHTYGCLY